MNARCLFIGRDILRMLTGAVPFSGSGMGEIMCRQISEPIPALVSIAPTAPLPVCTLVQDMLCKDRQQRPAMCQVLAALQALTAQPRARSGPRAAIPFAAATLARPARSTRQRVASVTATRYFVR